MNYRGAKVNIIGNVTPAEIHSAWLALQNLKLRKQSYYKGPNVKIISDIYGDIINLKGRGGPPEEKKKKVVIEEKETIFTSVFFAYDGGNSTYYDGTNAVCDVGIVVASILPNMITHDGIVTSIAPLEVTNILSGTDLTDISKYFGATTTKTISVVKPTGGAYSHTYSDPQYGIATSTHSAAFALGTFFLSNTWTEGLEDTIDLGNVNIPVAGSSPYYYGEVTADYGYVYEMLPLDSLEYKNGYALDGVQGFDLPIWTWFPNADNDFLLGLWQALEPSPGAYSFVMDLKDYNDEHLYGRYDHYIGGTKYYNGGLLSRDYDHQRIYRHFKLSVSEGYPITEIVTIGIPTVLSSNNVNCARELSGRVLAVYAQGRPNAYGSAVTCSPSSILVIEVDNVVYQAVNILSSSTVTIYQLDIYLFKLDENDSEEGYKYVYIVRYNVDGTDYAFVLLEDEDGIKTDISDQYDLSYYYLRIIKITNAISVRRSTVKEIPYG